MSGKRPKWTRTQVEWGRSLADYVGVSVSDLDWEDEYDWEEEEDGEDLEYERQQTRRRVEAVVPANAALEDVVPGALPEDLAGVLAEADELLDIIAEAEEIGTLTALDGRIAELERVVREAREAVRQRSATMMEILNAAREIRVPEGAEPEEAQRITDPLRRLATALRPRPLTGDALSDAREALEDATRAREDAVTNIRQRQQEHERIEQEGGEVDCEPFLADHVTDHERDREVLARALEQPVTTENNRLANEALETLRETVRRIGEETLALGDRQGLETLCSEAGVTLEQYSDLEGGLGNRQVVLDLLRLYSAAELGALCKGFGGGAKGAAALGGPDSMTALMAGCGGNAARAKAVLDGLGTGFTAALMGETKDPARAVALFEHLGADLVNFKALAADSGLDKKPAALAALYVTGCKGRPEAFETFCEGFTSQSDRENLASVLEEGGLADAPEAFGQLVATGCNGAPGGLVKFAAAFSQEEARAGLKRALTDGGLAGVAAEPPAGAIDPGCLAQMFLNGCGSVPVGQDADTYRAQQMAALFGGMDTDACGRFNGLLRNGGLGEAPAALGHAVGRGCDGDATQLDKLCTSFAGSDAQGGLKRLLDTGGFKGKTPPPLAKGDVDPACLGELLKSGMGPAPATFTGDPVTRRTDGLASLVAALDASDCTDLNAMLTEGGLGRAPAALGHLVGLGCDGDGGSVKDLLGAFDTSDKREGLERMLTTGGLAGKDGELATGDVDPACLGHILKNGAGTDGPPNAATRGATLAAVCTGLDGPRCADLSATLKSGGLGVDPEVLGHLVGTGCDKGDPGKLSGFVEQLAADGPAMSGLCDMLQKGGMGRRDENGDPVDIDASCLGHMLATGCDGKPDQMIGLVKALGATDLTNLKGVMVDGELGKHPKVLGKTYKNGCLDDPSGAHDGDKDPQVLKDMLGGFAPPGGPAKFKDLLDHGGFGDPGKEDRLGSVMRFAFTPKPPAAEKQQAQKLVQLHTAFNGHFGDLTDMMDAFETAPPWVLEADAPDEHNRPGKAFRNVVQAPGHGGDALQLRTKFFDKLDQRASAGAGYIPNGATRLTRTELLQHAASFEHEPIPNARVAVNSGDLRVDHVLDRHTRKHNVFNVHANNDPTTLYPHGTDEAVIVQRVNGALANIPNPNRGNRPHHKRPPTRKQNPPVDRYDLDPDGHGGYWTPYNNIADGDGTSKIGFARDGANFPAAWITQFYPKTGTNLIKVANIDMRAMRDATR